MLKKVVKIEKAPGDAQNPRGKIVYTYNDGSMEAFGINADGGKSYITYSDGTDYCLIEQQNQINAKLGGGDLDFARHIFLTQANFSVKKFQDEVDFEMANFCYGCDFRYAMFCKKVSFSYALFLGKSVFFEVDFSETANFNNTRFWGGASFFVSEFKGDAYFWDAEFHDKANFNAVKFFKRALFQGVKFAQTVNFESIVVEKSLMLGGHPELAGDAPMPVNLRGAIINAVEYTTAIFKYANRETAMVLKNLAIKQNDQVNAIDFYTKEMEIHLAELKSKVFGFRKFRHLGKFWFKILFCLCIHARNFINANIFILQVEKLASRFGTSPWRAFGWIFAWNILFLGVAWSINGCPPDSPIDAVGTLGWWQALYQPINIFLIYELVKSLRKFSRRL